jgi:hypothetical protein
MSESDLVEFIRNFMIAGEVWATTVAPDWCRCHPCTCTVTSTVLLGGRCALP